MFVGAAVNHKQGNAIARVVYSQVAKDTVTHALIGGRAEFDSGIVADEHTVCYSYIFYPFVVAFQADEVITSLEVAIGNAYVARVHEVYGVGIGAAQVTANADAVHDDLVAAVEDEDMCGRMPQLDIADSDAPALVEEKPGFWARFGRPGTGGAISQQSIVEGVALPVNDPHTGERHIIGILSDDQMAVGRVIIGQLVAAQPDSTGREVYLDIAAQEDGAAAKAACRKVNSAPP